MKKNDKGDHKCLIKQMRGDDKKKKKKDGKESKENIGRCKWEAHLSELQFHKPKQDINIFLLNSDFIQG